MPKHICVNKGTETSFIKLYFSLLYVTYSDFSLGLYIFKSSSASDASKRIDTLLAICPAKKKMKTLDII